MAKGQSKRAKVKKEGKTLKEKRAAKKEKKKSKNANQADWQVR